MVMEKYMVGWEKRCRGGMASPGVSRSEEDRRFQKFYLFHNKVSWMHRQAAAEKAQRNV